MPGWNVRRRLRLCVACIAFGLSAAFSVLSTTAVSAHAEQLQPRADQRWASDGPGGAPEFTRHVVPLLGKVGCNNRACHGSFQGQAGFRLSLFGHDARFDYTELTDEGEGPRVVPGAPDDSLALLKPNGVDEHEGGIRFEKGSWHERLFRDWIAAGAKFDPKTEAKLTRLVVTPAELQLVVADESQPQPLKAVAHFSDGTAEDVTPLTVFSTNDETVAEVSDAGAVTASGSGDTAIVAMYGGAVVTSHVIVPVPGPQQEFSYAANSPIDEFVETKLRKVNLKPSELCSDEEFLRRAYLDAIGTLPTPDEAREFLADTSPDKRSRLIDALLDRPEYGMYWATKFSDWTGNDNRFTPQPRAKTGWLWQDWLRDKLDRNAPYDEIAGGFLTATTREGRPLEEVVAEYKTIRENLDKGFDDGTYARRKTNDIFWQKAGNSGATVGLQVAYAFLGVRLECAQCHKHPFDSWTQDDFKGYVAIFDGLGRGVPKDVPKELTKKKSNADFTYREVYVDTSEAAIKRRDKQPPKQLAGEMIEYKDGQDPREALWNWMRSPDNPYFARAIANRLWGHYLGVGIVNPVDDFNAANPPSNPQLLDWLAHDFIESGFDLKHLHRRILNSRTYQLSWRPNDSNRLDERNFSHALLRRMPAEVVLDAINQVTGSYDDFGSSNAPRGTRAINLAPSRLRGGGPEYALSIFGRPLRTQTCDCERGTETGLAQAMYLLNDEDVNAKINNTGGKLAKTVKRIKDDRQLLEELYLGTLSRYPSDEEMKSSLEFLAAAKDRQQGAQDILWSLLNLREFVFNH